LVSCGSSKNRVEALIASAISDGATVWSTTQKKPAPWQAASTAATTEANAESDSVSPRSDNVGAVSPSRTVAAELL
jgi:hypothetical protein